MEENVEYVEDEDGDHWQSVQETLDNYTGDCEDQAILMASIVTALGGTARVNLIHEHAFPSVFVGSTSIEAEAASQAIRSYYGSQGDELHVCYLVDDLGYWMVIDTTGSPYAGGLPALAAPFHSANPESWTFEDSNYLVTIDVTGEESEGGFLGF
jgi:transglutaminase-like putative cysteine protease